MLLRYMLLVLVSVYFLGNRQASSAQPSDFFCAPLINQPPVYFDHQVKSCGDGQSQTTKTAEGICVERTGCVYLTDEMKDQVQKETGKAFASLSEIEKNNIRKKYNWDLLPADLTCPGERKELRTTSDGRKVYDYSCSQPEKCKGDALFSPKAAHFKTNDENSFGLSPESKDTFQFAPDQQGLPGVAK